MSPEVLSVILLTLQVATVSTLIVLLPATVLGYVLARYKFPGKNVLSALVGLPLVLPPTAVGFLLLRLFAVDGPLGRETLGFDLNILLTWKGAVIATAAMSLPLVARTAKAAFEGINPRLELMAYTLGYSRLATFFQYSLPMARRGLLGAVILGFTRAMGEFGATVTIAGNIPGRTQTIASAIFSAQQVGAQTRADLFMLVAIVLGFLAILSAELLGQGRALPSLARP